MPTSFEVLDFRPTRMGALMLQRRQVAALGGEAVYEVKLGGEYLMSSRFHEAEVALARLALEPATGDGWAVAVGGLGLGYTAAAVLDFERVARLVVIEALEAVVDWHRRGLVPNGRRLSDDPRCRFYTGDFFALARGRGFDPQVDAACFDAVLLDIDHTPAHWLHPSHGDFYTPAGLARLKAFLNPGGVFALWSNDPPDDAFLRVLEGVFDRVEGHALTFANPLQQGTATNGVYVARRR